MPSVVIQNFNNGLDARNMPEATQGGALLRANNCVINHGGEVEKHEAWNKIFSLPTGKTFGLRVISDITHVFGSVANPGAMPQKTVYDQLVPASGANMTGVIDTELFDGKIYVIATFDDGHIVHFYDGTEVTDLVDRTAVGKVTIAGTSGTVDDITVDGIQITIGQIGFNTDLTQTAKDVARNINYNKTAPNYRATPYGATVIISADLPGTDANGKIVSAAYSGLVVTVTVSPMAGGSAHPANEYQPGTFAYTSTEKMHSINKSVVHFSDINLPMAYDPTGPGAGAGFINMANHVTGSEEVVAAAVYFNSHGFFTRSNIQIWNLDPDPDYNAREQTLQNTGAVAPQSVVAYGNDVVYLSNTGVRSLQIRDSSRAANVNDIGTSIDPLLQELIANNRQDTQEAQAIVDPLTQRYYLSIGEDIYIFNFFPGNDVNAWTKSEPGFKVEQFDTRELRIVCRAGDSIYQLGGPTGANGVCPTNRYGTRGSSDNVQADIITPFIDAGDPSRFKLEKGLDLAIEGEWDVYLLTDPKDLTVQLPICTLNESTFKIGRLPLDGYGTHFAFRFVSRGYQYARISKILQHFDLGEQQ